MWARTSTLPLKFRWFFGASAGVAFGSFFSRCDSLQKIYAQECHYVAGGHTYILSVGVELSNYRWWHAEGRGLLMLAALSRNRNIDVFNRVKLNRKTISAIIFST